MAQSADPNATGPQLWPIFICYRQVDGLAAARRLYELLDKREVTGPKGESILFDVYLDQTMPAVADWREIHRPYLERARALIVICTPGAKIIDGPEDWVHKEISWWLEHRKTVPILIDPLRQGIRYVPTAIRERWPEIQRIPLVESEWTSLPAADLEQKASALRRQMVGNILPSGAAIYDEELRAERKRAEELSLALHQTEISRRISQASLYDAQAASYFDEARRHEARVESLRQLQRENRRKLNEISAGKRAGDPASPGGQEAALEQNLEYESSQLDEDMRELTAKAAGPRRQGYAQLKLAHDAWAALERDGHAKEVAARRPPDPPSIFSIELINAGSGESILIHYGTPDATRLVMLNGGPVASFKGSVGKRLQTLKMQRFAGQPTPIELFIASDQDEHKTGGLLRMLDDQANAQADRVVELRSVWANIFGAFGFRGQIRGTMDKIGISPNRPFDHIVIRPERGRAVHRLSDDQGNDLEVVVLGPERAHLRRLFEATRVEERKRIGREPLAPVIESFPDERFSRLTDLLADSDPLPEPVAAAKDDRCRPSKNARAQAKVAATDKSLPNLASTILLFRYRKKTFLHTGDSRADLITDALVSSGLMARAGRAHVDVLHIPHLGSKHNLTPAFLKRVTAGEYLFTGDGTHGNPAIETIAALVAARPCERFTMNFANRDSNVRVRHPVQGDPAAGVEKSVSHGNKLNAFFAAENRFNPSYRRFFRSPDEGSVIIDLLDRVTY